MISIKDQGIGMVLYHYSNLGWKWKNEAIRTTLSVNTIKNI